VVAPRARRFTGAAWQPSDLVASRGCARASRDAVHGSYAQLILHGTFLSGYWLASCFVGGLAAAGRPAARDRSTAGQVTITETSREVAEAEGDTRYRPAKTEMIGEFQAEMASSEDPIIHSNFKQK